MVRVGAHCIEQYPAPCRPAIGHGGEPAYTTSQGVDDGLRDFAGLVDPGSRQFQGQQFFDIVGPVQGQEGQ